MDHPWSQVVQITEVWLYGLLVTLLFVSQIHLHLSKRHCVCTIPCGGWALSQSKLSLLVHSTLLSQTQTNNMINHFLGARSLALIVDPLVIPPPLVIDLVIYQLSMRYFLILSLWIGEPLGCLLGQFCMLINSRGLSVFTRNPVPPFTLTQVTR